MEVVNLLKTLDYLVVLCGVSRLPPRYQVEIKDNLLSSSDGTRHNTS